MEEETKVEAPQEDNEQFLKRLAGETGGLATEVATGLALDAKTQWMLGAGPLGWAGYAAVNFGGGAASNLAAQKLRGEEDINYGELISSGLLGIIPFTSLRFGKRATKLLGKEGSIKRAVTGGAGMGASDRFIQSGINKGELPSPTDVAIGTVTGGALGAGFQKSFDEFGKIASKFKGTPQEVAAALKKDPDAQRHMTYWQEQVLKAQESGNTDEIRKAIWNYRKTHDTSGAYSKFTNYEDFVKESEDVTYSLIRNINQNNTLIPTFVAARKRGDVVKMTEAYNAMNPSQKAQLNEQTVDIGRKIFGERAEANRPHVPSREFPYLYNIKNIITDWRVGTRGKLDWYRFNRLSPGQKRLVGGRFVTDEVDRIPISWDKYAEEQSAIFESWYGESPTMKKLRADLSTDEKIAKRSGGKTFKRKGYVIDLDHGVTLVQSMPIYHGTSAGDPMFNRIQARFLSHALRPGDAVTNLTPLDRSVHSLKTAYFTKLHGTDGKGFFTDEIIRKFEPGPNWSQDQADNFRLATLDRYIVEVEKGQKIVEEAHKIYHTLHGNDLILPEQLADILADVLVPHEGVLQRYSSKQLRGILREIDELPEAKAALLVSLNDQLGILKDKILKLERELTIPGDPIISEAAEEFKLNQLSKLEKEFKKIELQRDNLFPP